MSRVPVLGVRSKDSLFLCSLLSWPMDYTVFEL